jgi:hypothetical protein
MSCVTEYDWCNILFIVEKNHLLTVLEQVEQQNNYEISATLNLQIKKINK